MSIVVVGGTSITNRQCDVEFMVGDLVMLSIACLMYEMTIVSLQLIS